MVKLYLKDQEQLDLLTKSNAARLLIAFTSLSDEIYYARDMLIFGEVPKVGRLTSMHIIRVAHSMLTPEKQAVIEQIIARMSLSDAHRFNKRDSFLCPEVQVKIFDFSKRTIKKILKNYCLCRSWELCDEAQVRMVEVFSPSEIKKLCRELHINLNEPALQKMCEIFPMRNAVDVLAQSSKSLSVNMFEAIRTRLPEPEAVNMLLAFIKHDGIMWDEIQRRILERFSQENAKAIFLAHLKEHGFMSDDVKVRLWHKFSYADALKIFKASSMVEKSVNSEVLLLAMYRFHEGEQLLLNYAKNGIEFDEEVQKELIDADCISTKTVKEIFLACQKHGYTLCRRAKRFLKRNS